VTNGKICNSSGSVLDHVTVTWLLDNVVAAKVNAAMSLFLTGFFLKGTYYENCIVSVKYCCCGLPVELVCLGPDSVGSAQGRTETKAAEFGVCIFQKRDGLQNEWLW